MVATGRAARRGVLVKGGAPLEALAGIDTVLLDKTGTVTQGRPEVVAITPAEGVAPEELLRVAAAAESASEHPLAGAVVAAARARGIAFGVPESTQAVPGGGVRARVGGAAVAVGAPEFVAGEGVALGDLARVASEEAGRARTAVVAARDGQPLGVIAIADQVRAESADAVAALRARGLAVALVTGDNERTAQAVAQAVGIDAVHARTLPAQKAQLVQRLQEQGRRVAMVGDGINDAPALAQASVGIAVGGGTQIAAEAADIVLLRPGLEGVVDAVDTARQTMRVVRQNLFWAFAYNTVGIPLAAGILWPWTQWEPGPMVAALAMSFSSVSVVANSLRLGRGGR
jgi:Cu+-exporting ATPase